MVILISVNIFVVAIDLLSFAFGVGASVPGVVGVMVIRHLWTI